MSRMSTPPIVGVPALIRWPWGPSARTCCPMLRNRTSLIHSGNSATAASSATTTTKKIWYVGYRPICSRLMLCMRPQNPFHHAFEPHRARRLHKYGVACFEQVVEHLGRLVHGRARPDALGTHARRPGAVGDAEGTLPDCHEVLDAAAGHVLSLIH